MPEILGTRNDDVLVGTNAGDLIRGRAGDDDLSGGLGNDRIQGGKGADTIAGEEGNDVCLGAAGEDTIDGFDGDDVLKGGGGNDEIRAGNGADRLAGGNGNDLLDGGEDDDVLSGGSGADDMYGRGGDDVLEGGRKNDMLNGGDGDDQLDGGSGDDMLLGRDGDDVLFGGLGDDHLMGHNGSDRLDGGPGNDTLDGAVDDDEIFGGPGDDSLAGGNGDDLLRGDGGDDVIDGGVGEDTVVFGGNWDEYDIKRKDGVVTVRDQDDQVHGATDPDHCVERPADCDDGTDTVSQAEMLVFADRTTNGDATNAFPSAGEDFELAIPRNAPPSSLGILDPVDADGHRLTVTVLELPDDTVGRVLKFDGTAVGAGEELETGDLVRLVFEPLAGAVGEAGAFAYRVDDGRGGTGEQRIDVVVVAPPPGVVDLGMLVGLDGFRITGAARDDEAGIAVGGGVDVDGDGFADVIVGARGADPSALDRAGQSWVVYGDSGRFAPGLSLGALGADDALALPGAAAVDRSGVAVAGVGDFDGDGLGDVAVGARGVDTRGDLCGAGYLVLGDVRRPAEVELGGLDGDDGQAVFGSDVDYLAGSSVASAGDINGDGWADVLIGAPGAPGIAGPDPDGDPETDDGSGWGQTFVVFGRPAPLAATVAGDELDGGDGFVVYGGNRRDQSGAAVALAGDVNGDGFDDILIGAPFGDSAGGSSGTAYVVFGGPGVGAGGAVVVDELDGSNGFVLRGAAVDEHAGTSVSGAGDVNGDGYADMLVGAPGASPFGAGRGHTYVVFGGADVGASGVVDLGVGGYGFLVRGADAEDALGSAVAGGGDVDGDGFDDIVLGAIGGDDGGLDSGEAWLVFGGDTDHGGLLDLFAVTPEQAWVLRGAEAGDHAGVSLAAGGDVNGDGFDDVVVGANLVAPDGVRAAGAAYVVLGGDLRGVVDHPGGVGDDLLEGDAQPEVFVGGTGDDTLVGGGGADVLRAGHGNDRIEVADASFALVDGDAGVDTLATTHSMLLDLTAIPAPAVRGIEIFDLGDSGSMLVLDRLAVQRIPESGSRVIVLGGAGDEVMLEDQGWSPGGQETFGDVELGRWMNGPAEVLIQTDIGAPIFSGELFEAGASQPAPVEAAAGSLAMLPDLLLPAVCLVSFVGRMLRDRMVAGSR